MHEAGMIAIGFILDHEFPIGFGAVLQKAGCQIKLACRGIVEQLIKMFRKVRGAKYHFNPVFAFFKDENVIAASWRALEDAVKYGLLRRKG